MNDDLFPERASARADDVAARRGATPAVIPVSALVAQARLLVERSLGLAWVSGEISGFSRATSGHCYFNLKDGLAEAPDGKLKDALLALGRGVLKRHGQG